VDKLLFGTDGWRGVIAEDFTYENVRKVAYAIARYVIRAENAQSGVIIGYDTRFNSERFARVTAEAVSMTGIPVWLADSACPTPAISLLVRQRKAAGGIVITASHNPYRWNGMKFKASYGSVASPAIVARIEDELGKVLRDGMPSLPPRADLIQPLDVRAPYLATLEKLVDWDRIRASNFRFMADSMYGAARGLLCELFSRNGVPCREIRGNHDPLFGGVNPEPIEPHVEALRQAIRGSEFDAGFCADGDGDRIGAMDPDGTFINPHQIFSLLLWHLAGTRNLQGGVAKSFSTTKMVDKIAARFGREVWETPIGFKYICDVMLERDALIGGEESGGIGTRLHLPERDFTVNALLLAEVMAWHGKRLGELVSMLHAEFGEHHYGRVDLELRAGQKEKALAWLSDETLPRLLDWPVVRRENLDGTKLYLGDIGWVLARASGTEALLRIYVETNQSDSTRSILDRLSAAVRAL
jgi:phosphomannomutase